MRLQMDQTNALPRRIRTQSRLEAAPRNSQRIARGPESCSERRLVRRSAWTRRGPHTLAESNIRETRNGTWRVIDRRRSSSAFRTRILQPSCTMSAGFSWKSAHSGSTFDEIRIGWSSCHLGSSRSLGVDCISDMESSTEATEFFCERTVASSQSTYECTVEWNKVMDRLNHFSIATTRTL